MEPGCCPFRKMIQRLFCVFLPFVRMSFFFYCTFLLVRVCPPQSQIGTCLLDMTLPFPYVSYNISCPLTWATVASPSHFWIHDSDYHVRWPLFLLVAYGSGLDVISFLFKLASSWSSSSWPVIKIIIWSN